MTVYGVADVYAGNFHSNGDTANAINAGGLQGNRLGFKGVEDLGGGLKALFTYEFGSLATDQAANNIGNTRQSFVGLTGGFGTVIAGRLQSLVYNHNAAYNPTFGTAVDTTNSVASKAGIAMGTQERLDNAVAYVAPAIGGLTLAGAYTAQASGAEPTVQTAVTAGEISADYTAGALAIGGVYRQANVGGGVGNIGSQIGASYDFGMLKLFAGVGTQANSADTATLNASDSRVSISNVSATVPVGANGVVIASVAGAKQSANDTNLTTSALVYKHSLSKRTSVYAGIANAKGDGSSSATLGGVTSGTQGNVTGVLAGINHNF